MTIMSGTLKCMLLTKEGSVDEGEINERSFSTLTVVGCLCGFRVWMSSFYDWRPIE